MDCQDVRARLNAHVDLELPDEERSLVREHLAGCPVCSGSYRALVHLKKLVHAKTRRPPAPPRLSHLIRRDLDSVRAGVRRRLAVAAMALFAVTAATAALWFLSPAPSGVAHPDVVRGCMEQFSSLLKKLQLQGGEGSKSQEPASAEYILGCVRRNGGIKLDGVPFFSDARYLGCTPCTVAGVEGVRLDFQCLKATSSCSGRISVFAFPRSKLKLSGEFLAQLGAGHLCHCVDVDNTVFCARSLDFVFNVVTDIGEDDFRKRQPPQVVRVLGLSEPEDR